jgi:uncharacterized protein YfaS (alpha-2-macroglobulin family)
MRLAFQTPRLVQLLSFALGLGLACAPSGPPPHPPPSAQLGLPAAGDERPAPFQLIHFGPRGEALADPTIQLAFNRPLRPLGVDTPPPGGLSIRPEVPGAWHWVGTHGLTFVPAAGRLPRATSFQVDVPASITSSAGERLPTAVSFSFVTPVPDVLAVSPSGEHQRLGPKEPLRIGLSTAVDAAELTRFVRVWAAAPPGAPGGKPVPVTVLADPDSKEGVLVFARSSWPKATTLGVEVASGWRGAEGSEAAPRAYAASVQTYGPPHLRLTCDRDPKGRCRPDGWFALEADNAIDARALSRAVQAQAPHSLSLDTDWWEGATTSYLSLSPRVAPGDAFAVGLKAPVRDVYGQAIGSIEGGQVKVGDYRSQARIGFEGQLLLPTVRSISVHALNAKVTVVVRALSLAELTALERASWEGRFAHLERLAGGTRRDMAQGPLNQNAALPIDLDALLGGGSGAFAVGVRYLAEDGQIRTEVKTAQRSRLGLTVKRGRDRGLVWVTSTDTGAPVSGARVQVLGQKQALTTDAQGLVTLGSGQFAAAPLRQEPDFLEVRAGQEVCVISSRENIGPWRLPVDTDFWSEVSDRALVFAERDLFRPGESAWIKGYVRRPSSTGNAVLPPEALTLTLTGPDGEVTQKHEVRTNQFGAFSAKLEFPLTATRGGWTIALLRNQQELGRTNVAVRSYRPAEFEVQVTPSVLEMGAGESVDFRVRGTYFFGGAMGRATTKVWVTRQPDVFVPKGTEGYETTDDAADVGDEQGPPAPGLLETEGALDPSGLLRQSVIGKLPRQRGPERITLEAEVTDVSRQALAGRASVLVHPASYYLGIRQDESSFLEVGRAYRPTVVAVTPGGKRLEGRPVDLELSHLRYAEVEQAMEAGHRRMVRTLVRETVSRCRGTAQARPVCDLLPSRPGQYVLRASSVDERGRSVHASRWLYALGEGQAGFKDELERGSVQVTLDRETYRPGQTARLLVQSPFQRARAWVTLEREGVLSSRMVELKGPTPVIEIPVTEQLLPNAFVGVHLLEDRSSAGKQARPLDESYRFGYADLRLDPELARLRVDVRADRAEYRPRDEVTLSLGVQDRSGAPSVAEVAVFVVDEGVLSLSGYQLPDPVAAFAGPRPLRVETIEGREGLARLVGLDPAVAGNKGEPGGDGGDARANFLTAAFFHPGVVTDASGRATVRFRLPDNLGRFRVMAMAVSERDRYGSGRTEVTVNRPLMARPALPRFLRAGDSFDVGVVVDSRSAQSMNVEVRLEVNGVELVGGAERTVKLPARGSVLVEFPARAAEAGTATLTFRVKSPQGEDSVRISREVQLPTPIETVAGYGRTESARAERLTALVGVKPNVGGVDVTVSSSALVGLTGSFDKLEDYPYACSEQLASRLLPLVAMRTLSRRFDVAGADADPARIETTVADLLGRQQGDGGFGLWPESLRSDPWVSGYALFALGEARRQKVEIPQLAIERGRRYLEGLTSAREPGRLPEATLAAFALGRLGHPDVGTLSALLDVRQQMPLFSRALLLWALADAKHEKAVSLLEPELESLVTLRGNRAEVTELAGDWDHYFASSARLHALVLRALLAAAPKTELAPALVRSLLEARQAGSWATTQEAAFSLLALEAYASAQEQASSRAHGSVFLGEGKLGDVSFDAGVLGARMFSVPMARVQAPTDLVVATQGGPLFYEARLRFARSTLPTEPLEQGFVIQRSLYAAPAAEIQHARDLPDQNSFEASSLVVAELTVLVPSRRRFVVIDDPLPAGLEAVDFHLSTSAGEAPSTTPDGYSYAWFREEIRDDRVLYFIDDMPAGLYRYRYLTRATTKGRFVTPPTVVMEMYQEEVFARTGARQVEVR